MEKSLEEQNKRIWSNRIYDEILSYPKNLYESLDYDVIDAGIVGKKLEIDIKLSVQLNNDSQEQELEDILTKISKTLNILTK
ncbi:hypothetical protein [Paenibacillus sp. FSL H3-0286]|uniref:hypothetical protein n=1 Tax=Paenibacillus sp. FSL H3-0286 TaxID=2921427 RepID=UPI00324FC341